MGFQFWLHCYWYCTLIIYSLISHAKKLFLKIYFKSNIKNISSIPTLQNAINVISDRFSSWSLQFAVNKCAVLRFWRNFKNHPQPYYFLNNDKLPIKFVVKDLEVLIERNLYFHKYVQTKAQITGELASNLLKTMSCKASDFIKNFLYTYIRPTLEYCSLWNLNFVFNTKLLESFQRRWTKNVVGCANKSYTERLKELDIVFHRIDYRELTLYYIGK